MKTIAALAFPGFQTLDYFGPIEILGNPELGYDVITVAKTRDPVVSRHNQYIVPDKTIAEKTDYDLLFIPGGDSALDAAKDPALLQWIVDVSANADRVMAVCTGTIVLGLTGVLDGRRATTNKQDFVATVPLVPNVTWVKEARWVEDGKFFTSSGVSAGMDMALGVVADLFDTERALKSAEDIEYTWHRDKNHDPFAALAGLV